MDGAFRYVISSAPESWELALADVRAGDPTSGVGETLWPGVFLMYASMSPPALAKFLREEGSFVRHLFPVGASAPAGETAPLMTGLRDLLREPGLDGPFGIQRRVAPGLHARSAGRGPASLPPLIVAEIERVIAGIGGVLRDEAPGSVVSVVETSTTTYVGVSSARDNLSAWPGGAHRLARDPDQVSRAAFKLTEALALFGLTVPPRGTALDLGASPGGWTQVLRGLGMRVAAVDPGALDARLAHDPGITTVRTTAEAFLAGARSEGRFDLLVNDMRMDALKSARLMVEASRLLAPAAPAVMTIKLGPLHRRRQVSEVRRVLARAYDLVGSRQLFHNRDEVTVAMRLRGR